MLRLMIYKSMRNDWALALFGDGEPTVLKYCTSIEAAQELATNIFKQPLKWRPRTGYRIINDDHPAISHAEQSDAWLAFLHI